jgi:hypothetical protein
MIRSCASRSFSLAVSATFHAASTSWKDCCKRQTTSEEELEQA